MTTSTLAIAIDYDTNDALPGTASAALVAASASAGPTGAVLACCRRDDVADGDEVWDHCDAQYAAGLRREGYDVRTVYVDADDIAAEVSS